MMPPTDIELVHRVKDQNDSAALAELTNRHSGIYIKIAQQYSGFSDKIQIDELKDDRQYNIYKWIIDYKEDKNMKLGTYIGERTRYMCLNLMNKTPEKVPMDSIKEVAVPPEPIGSTSNVMSDIQQNVNIPDDKFWPIFKARHLSSEPKTWRQIGKEMGITHEWARQIYRKYIPKVREKVRL